MRDRSKTHQTSETDAAEKTGSPSHDRIAVRAYELFEQRGHSGGRAGRKLDQSAAQKVDHLRAVHSTLF